MQEIADWLTRLGLPEYAGAFAENGIDVAVLPHLTDQVVEMGGKVAKKLGETCSVSRFRSVIYEVKLPGNRAAMSMARLWRDESGYGWFTESFDTVDLKETKALLDELRALEVGKAIAQELRGVS
jgi:hypothetical protein